VDADQDMIAAARTKAPELSWTCADLAVFSADSPFDVVVLAGNVIPYVAAGSRADAVAACARALEMDVANLHRLAKRLGLKG